MHLRLKGKDSYVTFHIDAAVGANKASKHLDAAMTFLQWLEGPKFADLLGNQLPGFFPLGKDAPQLTDPIANTFMGFNSKPRASTSASFGKNCLLLLPAAWMATQP